MIATSLRFERKRSNTIHRDLGCLGSDRGGWMRGCKINTPSSAYHRQHILRRASHSHGQIHNHHGSTSDRFENRVGDKKRPAEKYSETKENRIVWGGGKNDAGNAD